MSQQNLSPFFWSVTDLLRGDYNRSEYGNPEYYNHFINSTPGLLYIDLTAWGSGQPNISVPIIQRMHTVAPPHNDRDEIVKYIISTSGQYDGLIAEAERAIDLLQERRTALISAAVTGKIDVREFECKEAVV